MRRKDKEISNKSEIERIINSAKVCHLALVDGSQPYVVPLNFGYRDNTVYFHSATQGRKLDLIRANPRVCVEFSILFDIVRAEENCKWGQKFESVIGFGNARLVEDADEKRRALDIIMDHYGGKGGDYPDKKLKLTAVIEVVLTGMTGKGSV